MARQKARKVVVSYTIALDETERAASLRALKARAEWDAKYVATAIGGDAERPIKTTVTEAE